MDFHFKKHYTVDEAREMIPQLRLWLTELRQHQEKMVTLDDRVGQLLATGADLGGALVNDSVRQIAGVQKYLAYFRDLEIQIKDIDRGLVDFPAVIAGREVFLCWEEDEDNIEFWHDLDTGYAGRARLPEA
jgi:hypothetical protein